MDLSGVKRECSDGVSGEDNPDVQPLQSKRICVQNENGKLFYVQIEKKPSGETLDLVPHPEAIFNYSHSPFTHGSLEQPAIR